MNNSFWSNSCKTGFAGGTLLTLISSIVSYSDIVKTVILAATGAIVSFIVSFILRWLLHKKR